MSRSERLCEDCGEPTPGARRRCPACAAVANPRRLPTAVMRRSDGEYLVSACWCQTTTVWVPKAQVARGLTKSCGRPGCEQPRSAA